MVWQNSHVLVSVSCVWHLLDDLRVIKCEASNVGIRLYSYAATQKNRPCLPQQSFVPCSVVLQCQGHSKTSSICALWGSVTRSWHVRAVTCILPRIIDRYSPACDAVCSHRHIVQLHSVWPQKACRQGLISNDNVLLLRVTDRNNKTFCSLCTQNTLWCFEYFNWQNNHSVSEICRYS